jgi:hypothetical protein
MYKYVESSRIFVKLIKLISSICKVLFTNHVWFSFENHKTIYLLFLPWFYCCTTCIIIEMIARSHAEGRNPRRAYTKYRVAKYSEFKSKLNILKLFLFWYQ